jgi:hypothetical protein
VTPGPFPIGDLPLRGPTLRGTVLIRSGGSHVLCALNSFEYSDSCHNQSPGPNLTRSNVRVTMAVAFIPTVRGRALHRAHELAMPPSLTLDQIVDTDYPFDSGSPNL